jgi:hypothetical protein
MLPSWASNFSDLSDIGKLVKHNSSIERIIFIKLPLVEGLFKDFFYIQRYEIGTFYIMILK